LLDEARISYEVYNHPLAYTAQEIAAPTIINHGQTTDLIFEQYLRGFSNVAEELIVRTFSVMTPFTRVRSR
jgi:hypothetical protein